MDENTVPTFTEFIAALGQQLGKKLTLTGAVLPDGKEINYGREDGGTKGHASKPDEDVRSAGGDGRSLGADLNEDA